VEHNLDTARGVATTCIEAGAEGGDAGGYLMADRNAEDLARSESSLTGQLPEENQRPCAIVEGAVARDREPAAHEEPHAPGHGAPRSRVGMGFHVDVCLVPRASILRATRPGHGMEARSEPPRAAGCGRTL